MAREWQKKNPIRYSWNNARQSAKTRGYVWELTEIEYESLVRSDCSYCGTSPAPINGVDRIDNLKGYSLNNVTTACADCNYAKRRMSRDKFIAWAFRLVSHQKGE